MVHTTLALCCRRDVSPFLVLFRNILFGRKWVQQLRWQDDLSSKDQPQPELPDGPAHRLSKNFYHLRDNRRKYQPDIIIAPQPKRLTGGSELTQAVKSELSTEVTPGFRYIPETNLGENFYTNTAYHTQNEFTWPHGAIVHEKQQTK
ncbi:NADH dehydrogenase [ubiquinone] 1 alpha subcomplex subunit 7-like [Brevipalpus obovatus]|uniref:NADH dehydrogenase [ubiquinone] 1 alpha subcomplex subunit 7-like n=1 Tax=Brevipalpus obovatus TaxID=246614 RepID=UPI003D9E9004